MPDERSGGKRDAPARFEIECGRYPARVPITPAPAGETSGLLLARRRLFADPLFLLAELRRELRAEVLGLEHGADFDLRLLVVRVRAPLQPLDGLVHRLNLPQLAQCRREWNIMAHTPVAMASLGHVYAWSGRINEGVASLQQAVTVHKRAGIGVYHSLSVTQLGEAYLLADQVENARACADRAVMLARGRGERGYEAWALRLLGDIASHHASPDVATAEAHYSAAMTLASELEMRPLVAHCHFGLGRLYGRAGDPEQAQEHLTTARTMYGEMGMTYWLEKLEKSM